MGSVPTEILLLQLEQGHEFSGTRKITFQSYWWKYFNFFQKWIPSCLEAGLALVRKLLPQICAIPNMKSTPFGRKEERKKTYPSKRDKSLCLEIMSFKLLFFGKKLGKCRNIHLSEVSTSAALWAWNSSWPKCGHVLGLCKAVLWF